VTARLIGLTVLRPEQANRAAEVLEGKFYRDNTGGKQGVPMAPLILGFVLGDLMEQNLRRALLITHGELGILFESDISKGLWLAAVVVALAPLVVGRLRACV